MPRDEEQPGYPTLAFTCTIEPESRHEDETTYRCRYCLLGKSTAQFERSASRLVRICNAGLRFAVRAALKATLEKGPTERWIIGSNDVARSETAGHLDVAAICWLESRDNPQSRPGSPLSRPIRAACDRVTARKPLPHRPRGPSVRCTGETYTHTVYRCSLKSASFKSSATGPTSWGSVPRRNSN